MCVVVCTLCCGVVCSVGGVWCGVVFVLFCVVWCGLACGKPLRVLIENASVCAFKTPQCVPGKCPHVFNMRAFSRYTRRRLERTHGGVLNLHTEGVFRLLCLSCSLSVFLALALSLLLFLCSLLSCLLSLFFLSPLLSSLSETMTMITRPIGLSLCTHGSDLPECQCACASVHSLFGEHVHIIMQETTVLALLCKPRVTWSEVGLYLCWKWVLC